MERALNERVSLAKQNIRELNALLSDYIPFIKSCVAKMAGGAGEQEDAMTVAMLAFANSVKLYESDRGEFLSFAAFHIKHRIVDEWRRQNRHTAKVVPLFPDVEGDYHEDAIDAQLAVKQYHEELQRRDMAYEIDAFSTRLETFGIRFSELEKISPKQKRARALCLSIAKMVAANSKMADKLLGENRIPVTELAASFGISVKTVEKHRKYIVVLALLLMGDYPHIRAFLPDYGR